MRKPDWHLVEEKRPRSHSTYTCLVCADNKVRAAFNRKAHEKTGTHRQRMKSGVGIPKPTIAQDADIDGEVEVESEAPIQTDDGVPSEVGSSSSLTPNPPDVEIVSPQPEPGFAEQAEPEIQELINPVETPCDTPLEKATKALDRLASSIVNGEICDPAAFDYVLEQHLQLGTTTTELEPPPKRKNHGVLGESDLMLWEAKGINNIVSSGGSFVRQFMGYLRC